MKNASNKRLHKSFTMIPILTPLLLPLFLHIITVHVAGDTSPIYTPVDDITLQCGFSGDQLNSGDNRTWTGDINSKFSPFENQAAGSPSIARQAPSSSSVRQVPYTTARLSRSEFTYRFPVTTTGHKFIRLYFNPASYGPDLDRSKALFSVKAGGFTLLKDFDSSVTADASGFATIYREFCLNLESEQSLNITFTPSRATRNAYAFINGIEIVSMPNNLYYTSPQDNGAAYIGSQNRWRFRIEKDTALEMVYRFNVGGRPLLFNLDTGMYRNWDGVQEEDKYLDDLSYKFSVLPQNSSIELNFTQIPEYSAPKEVYQTGRSMGTNKTTNKGYDLIWEFPVDAEFSYLVRLHFCEFEYMFADRLFQIPISDQTAEYVFADRLFQISVANQTVEYMFDKMVSLENGFPIYKDYVVFMPAGPASQKKVNLFLALQASPNDSWYNFNDAILNGLEIFKLSDTSGNLAGPNPDPPLLTPRVIAPPQGPRLSNKSSTSLIAIIAGLVSGALVLGAVLMFFLVVRRGRKNRDLSSSQGIKWGPFSFPTTKLTKGRGSYGPSYLCRYFSLAEIKAATRNFDDSFIIGVGGFGNVYKGCIDGGATIVAIKRLKPESSQGAHEFKTEIELLSQLRHHHLVSLIGYCKDGNEMVLVYDYMSRGTLASHLYHTDNPPLSWDQRLQICIEAAIGLRYLHSGAKGTIIHRDVKSTNILLNEKWVAKISDFGLSKISTTSTSKTHISTMVKGSFGYLDPEYYQHQRLTEKSDVYSFGVVLCEVLCARPAVMHNVELRQINLAEWAKSCHCHGELDQIIDPSIRGKTEIQCLNKFVEIAVSCMNDSGIERPSMNDVVKGLEIALQLHRNWVERNNEAAFNNDSAAEIRRAEPSCATNESIQYISETIFSEINDPNGR